MPISFKIKGLEETLSKLEGLPAEIQQEVDDELTASAYMMADEAMVLAPVDLGALKNSIKVVRNEPLLKQVSATVEYAAYQEFGTGTFVSITPAVPGLAEYAIQFKGAGLRKVNIHAQPFFFPAYLTATKDLIKRLKAAIEQTAKR